MKTIDEIIFDPKWDTIFDGWHTGYTYNSVREMMIEWAELVKTNQGENPERSVAPDAQ